MERHTGAQSPKTESDDTESTTFTSATQASPEPEVLEWRAPSDPETPSSDHSTTFRKEVSSQSQRWEDEAFAGRVYSSEATTAETDSSLSSKSEIIRREVADSLDMIRVEEMRMELEMSAEEEHEVEDFDPDAYQ